MTASNGKIANVLIVGGGTAGLLTALALQRQNPSLTINMVRSDKISHIMVGEGTFGSTPYSLHKQLGIPVGEFYREVNPTWKLGIRFLWGTRPYFNYSLEDGYLLNSIGPGKTPVGYFCTDENGMEHLSLTSSLMSINNAFARDGNGAIEFGSATYGYHFENERIVSYLEARALSLGIRIRNRTIAEVATNEHGVAGLVYDDGSTDSADLYVDSSGFSGLLMHKALQEPRISFRRSLFCDRAVVGGWQRAADEPVKPYTTAETMDAGWCWQIEHERLVNRGYVYCSAFAGDDAAEREFRQKNPKVQDTRIVRFEPGRSANSWVGNVVSVGNANGFTEPLEATNIQVIIETALSLASTLALTDCRPGIELKDIHNRKVAQKWRLILDFLALHYRFNDRLDTPFWRMAREETPLGDLEAMVNHYRTCGPNLLPQDLVQSLADPFGMSGYFAMLLGMQVPHANTLQITGDAADAMQKYRRANLIRAMNGVSVEQALAETRMPDFSWARFKSVW